MDQNVASFLAGLLLLILFAWYVLTDADRPKRIVGTILAILLVAFCLQSVIPPFDVYEKDASGNVVKDENTGKPKLLKRGRVNLGLDLRGGTSFLIRLMPTDEAGGERSITSDMVEQAMEAIRKRVDEFGVSEPIITPQGADRILVQIPGLDPAQIAEAREQLQKVAKLEFKLVHPRSDAIAAGAVPPDPAYKLETYSDEREGKEVQEKLVIKKRADVTGDMVTEAHAIYDQRGWGVSLKFNSKGADLFGQLTQEHVHERFAIVLDGKVMSAPVIQEPIPGGTASITGHFSEKQARGLASALQNPLQTPVKIEEERSASSTLGGDAIRSGVVAGIGGLLLVMVFVVIYYRFAGAVAIAGLIVNIIVLFGVMSMFNFVLTLPGIAGVILTIGLAVDANVLIYERLREEMDAGKTLGAAISSAYDKAFTVIFDANATTLITAAILFWRASGPVKGFAVTLTVGVIASVFSAMVVTRVLFSWALQFNWVKRISMLHIIPTGKNFNFLGKRHLWVGLSVALMLLLAVGFGVRYPHNLGIDFRGGDLLMLSTEKAVSEGQVREAIHPLNLGEVTIQKESTVGAGGADFITVRSPSGTADKIEQHLMQTMPEVGFKEHKKDHVGKIVGDELTKGSLLALGLGMLGIFVYVTMRFEFSFAIGALVALLHDVIVTVGVFSLVGRELSLVIVGAILTIAGYSINDTIVVFDRIREGLHAGRKGSIQDIMNASINETLSRTLLTSGCTFLSVAALFLFGGPVLRDFAFVMLIGIVVGTYSSIFIASPIVLWWSGHKGERLRNEMAGGDTVRSAA